MEPSSGAVRWTYRGKGAIERQPEIGGDLVYVATETDRIVALEAATGKWRWQYERDMPDGFTIHGYAGPRLHGQHLLTGFADGYFVALSAASGEVVWARSLAATSEQFVDVDTTPTLAGDLAYVSSYSGGLCAVDLQDGVVKWRLPIQGVGDVSVTDGRLFFVAPRQGLHAADLEGHVLWRQGLTEAGDLTRPAGIRALSDFFRQPRRPVRRRPHQRRAAGGLQPGPRRVRRAAGRRITAPPVRAVERRQLLRAGLHALAAGVSNDCQTTRP